MKNIFHFYVYFPCEEYISFLRELIDHVMENANEHNLKRYGRHLVKVTIKHIESNHELQHKFDKLVRKRMSDHNIFGDFQNEIVSVIKN